MCVCVQSVGSREMESLLHSFRKAAFWTTFWGVIWGWRAPVLVKLYPKNNISSWCCRFPFSLRDIFHMQENVHSQNNTRRVPLHWMLSEGGGWYIVPEKHFFLSASFMFSDTLCCNLHQGDKTSELSTTRYKTEQNEIALKIGRFAYEKNDNDMFSYFSSLSGIILNKKNVAAKFIQHIFWY